jgi:streptogramin lyase
MSAAIVAVIVAVLPASAQPRAVVPALAITRPRGACGQRQDVPCLPVAVSGAGFERPGTPYLWMGSRSVSKGRSRIARISSTDARVLEWSDRQIVLGLGDADGFPQWVRVKSGGRLGGTVPVRAYAYATYPTSSASSERPPPLALALDDAGRVFVNEEFHTGFKMWTPQGGVVEPVPYPEPPEAFFAQNLFGDTPARYSILGEDAIVDPEGIAWFTEGGASLYGGMHANRSRIVSYDQARGRTAAYRVPGDRTEAIGLAWDRTRHRLWFSVSARTYDCIPFFGCAIALPARLVSFDPARVTPDDSGVPSNAGRCHRSTTTTPGTCSNVPSRPCLTATDCELAERICPPGVVDDAACYHEYAIPITKAGHLVVDASGAVWFTAFGGGNYLGRLDPASGRVTAYPLPAPLQGWLFGAAPWQIAIARDGAVVCTLFADGALARFDTTRVDDPSCLALDAAGENPCIVRRVPPNAAPGELRVHSLAIDTAGNTWFSQTPPAGGTSPAASVGYVTPDWRDIVMLPPLGLFPCAAGGTECGVLAGTHPPFAGTGIAVDTKTGGVWIAAFSERLLGRLLPLAE